MRTSFEFKTACLKSDTLTDKLKKISAILPDPTTGTNGQYTMKDAALSALSVFFYLNP